MPQDEPESEDLASKRTDWAEDRTDWAEDRTVLANERTFAGWMRTGLSAVAIGLGVQAIFQETEPTWLAKGGATVFIAIGIVIFGLSLASSRKLLRRLETKAVQPLSGANLTVVAGLFILGSILLAGILWLL